MKWALTILLLLIPSLAHAHVRSVSWSTWTIAGTTVEGRLRMSALDASAIGDVDATLRAHVALEPCALESISAGPADVGFLVRTMRFRCPEGASLRVKSDLFLDRIPSHLHFAQLSRDGGAVAEQMLSRDRQAWNLPTTREGLRFSEMIALGVRHILSGADHLVFLLTLIVAAASFRALTAIVTGFTVGHSLSLALAVLWGVRPPANAIEALVGLTIVIVAVENVWLARKDPWLPRVLLLGIVASTWFFGARVALGLALFTACVFAFVARSPNKSAVRGSVTALFGLVHGFAFSSVLTEMALPRARLASALFGFNLGVELGQLAVLALAWPVFRLLMRTRLRRHTLDLASAGALAAGVYWAVTRVALL